MPRNLPRKGVFHSTDQFVRGVADHMAIDPKRHFYIAVAGQVLDFLDVHSGLTEAGDIGMAQQVRGDLKIKGSLELGPAPFTLGLGAGSVRGRGGLYMAPLDDRHEIAHGLKAGIGAVLGRHDKNTGAFGLS